MSTVHQNIKTQRLLLNYTQEHVAKCLNKSIKLYGAIERGKARIYVDQLELLAQTLKTDVPTLIGLPSNKLDTTPSHLKHYVVKISTLPFEEQELIFQLIETLAREKK